MGCLFLALRLLNLLWLELVVGSWSAMSRGRGGASGLFPGGYRLPATFRRLSFSGFSCLLAFDDAASFRP
jgi:hypothetical protein